MTTGRVLQRCSLCKKFHAFYQVEDARLGKLKLCRDCWNDRQAREKESNPPTSPSV